MTNDPADCAALEELLSRVHVLIFERSELLLGVGRVHA